MAFIHRFGSTLNPHLHFHCVVLDGVFESTSAGGLVFHPVSGIDQPAIVRNGGLAVHAELQDAIEFSTHAALR